MRSVLTHCRIPHARYQTAVQQRALRVLKQKRMYENQLSQLVQQSFNMESVGLATENLRNTMATVDAMKVANKELKKQYGKIDIDKIEVSIIQRWQPNVLIYHAELTIRDGGSS